MSTRSLAKLPTVMGAKQQPVAGKQTANNAIRGHMGLVIPRADRISLILAILRMLCGRGLFPIHHSGDGRSVLIALTLVDAGGLTVSSSHCSQSSPNSSTGCCVRIVPLPQRRSSAAQYLSHPQQIRSGCFGLSAIFGFVTVIDG